VKAVATGESAVRRALRDGSKLTGSALAKWVNSEARRVKIIRTKVDSADGRIRRAELQLANAKLDGQSATAEARQATGKLRNTQERLDEDCRELADAVKRISAVTTSADPASERSRTGAQIEALEERRRVAGATLAQSEKEIASARTGLQYATSTASKAEAEALRAERRLEQALAKAEFLAATDARKAIRDPAAQARLEKQITEYESSHTTAFQAVDRLKATLAGRSVSESELAVAKQRLEEIRAERDALQLSVVQRQQDVLRLEKALGKALSLREAAERSRAKLVLYRTLSTDLGSAAFQRFLLEEAFADMVSGASKRLRELTGRYTLAWDDGEFFVVDHDNASERRRAETLSGGETFLASLSLALQLSDQVLQTSGAVRLDSLFIDEGFGTLDPATLDVVGQAIEALQVGGRMVGIITHIAALTERLPGCVRISKGPNSARWNVERVG
jgi:exonuclease SbcC